MRVRFVLTSCLIISLLSGCGSSPVADDLGQREANKLVSVLGEHNIEATTEKARGSKGRYSVVVSSGDFGAAVALLTKYNLPSERGASFEDLMAPSGILPPSADVENLRMDRAIASEVEQLLLGDDTISAVSVVVRSHSIPAGASPSVSIVAQVSGGSLDQEKIRELVMKAVPGLQSGGISFSISQGPGKGDQEGTKSAEPLVAFLKFWRVPMSEYNSLAYLLIGVLSVVAFLAGIGGYIYGQYEAAKSSEGVAAGSQAKRGQKAGSNGRTTGEGENV